MFPVASNSLTVNVAPLVPQVVSGFSIHDRMNCWEPGAPYVPQPTTDVMKMFSPLQRM